MKRRLLPLFLCLATLLSCFLFACSPKTPIEDHVSEDELKKIVEVIETPKPTVFIAADTTAPIYATQEGSGYNRQGWPYYMNRFFSEDVTFRNFSSQLDSSRSFSRTQGYLNLFDNMEKGDFLLIHFGHVDSREIEEAMTSPYISKNDVDENGMSPDGKYSFEWFITEKYVKPALEIGATPVLISPVCTLRATGPTNESHVAYNEVLLRIANEQSIPFLDVATESYELFEKVNTDQGYEFFEAFFAFQDEAQTKRSTVVLSYDGAFKVAEMIANGVREKIPALATWLLAEPLPQHKVES